jgi:RecT family
MPELYKSAKWSEPELQAIRKEFAPGANDEQWTLFISQCERRNLEPGRHVVFGLRESNKFDKDTQAWVTENKVTLITTVEALKLLAERTGKLKGIRPVIWYYATEGEDFKQSRIPLGRICHAASVEILRSDWSEPGFGVARYDACVQRKRDKTPNSVWEKRGEEMTGKCAKADAFRNTFFEECGDLFIKEELQGSGEAVPEQGTTVPETVAPYKPIIPVTLQVNQAPAAVVADVRPADNEPVTFAVGPESKQLLPLPTVSEAAITRMHEEAASPALPETAFDEQLDGLLGSTAPALNIPPAPAPVEVKAVEVAPPQPPTAGTPAVLAISVAPPQAVPVDDGDKAPGTTSPAFKAFTARCTVLVRDVMSKAGEKNGSPLLMAYIAAKSGKKTLGEVTTNQWKAILEVLEKAGSPQKTLALVKAK